MIRLLAMVLFAVELGAGFGSASATVVSTSNNAVEVELRVEVTQSAESIVAHLVFEDQPEVLIPLVQRENGIFGITTEIQPLNYQVVFEGLGPDPFISEPRSLAMMGADIGGGGETVVTTTTEANDVLSDETRAWGWLGLALGAAALSVLAFWVLGGTDDQSEDASSDSAPSEEDI